MCIEESYLSKDTRPLRLIMKTNSRIGPHITSHPLPNFLKTTDQSVYDPGCQWYLPLEEAVVYYLKSSEVKSITAEPLKIHAITHEYRAKMIDWMVEVTSTFKCDPETCFIAVKLMDLSLIHI